MVKFTRLGALALAALLVSACGGGPTVSSTPTSSLNNSGLHRSGMHAGGSGARNWQISAGADRRDHGLQGLDFYTSTITIDAGDSITWNVQASDHTISFLLPGQSPFTAPTTPAGGSTEDGSAFTSSGILGAGQSYTLTFPKAGTYAYNCLLHPPEMVGQVIVQPAGTAYPHPQGYYRGQGNKSANADLSAAQRSVALFPYTNGGTTLVAGISPGLATGVPNTATVYRFLGADNLNATTTTVSVGTTVTWVNQTNNEPHTVTFPVAGQPLPPAVANNPFSPPSGGTTYDGSTLTNSGPFGSATGFPTNSYSLMFTKPGTYIYYCLFHDEFGMVGTIVVR
jgi:plastocyanin